MTPAERSQTSLPYDPWVDGAAAVRHAVLLTAGVAGLSDSALYQIQGPGEVVRGVSVTASDDGIPAISVAIVVDATVAADRVLLGAVCDRVRSAAESTWARAVGGSHPEQSVSAVTVHVVDVSAA